MKIEVSDEKVTITMWGKTHESDFEYLVKMFKYTDENERKRLAIIHFDGSYFKDITPRKKEKPYIPPLKQSMEWDYEAQQELDDIQDAARFAERQLDANAIEVAFKENPDSFSSITRPSET
jgi:hypothetical protein